MKTKRSLYLAIGAMLMAMLACSGPGGITPTPDLTAAFGVALTAAFATAQALPLPGVTGTSVAAVTPPTEAASLTVPSVEPAGATPTTQPAGMTATTAPSVTAGPTACTDTAQFVADVTIPDGTRLAARSTFTKTWRIQNTGTCTWSQVYFLNFAAGARMDGPIALAFPGYVAPNATMDISVNFTSPATPGDYAGKWQLTNPAGSSFLEVDVVINVPVPPTATLTATATPTNTNTPAGPTTITLNPSSQGGIHTPGTVIEFPLVGDDASDRSYQGFVTFNLSGIPSGATITSVKLDLKPYDAGGSTFPLGCLRVFQQNYGTLDAGDFFTGSALGALWRFCNEGDLTSASAQSMASSGIATFQASLASGQFQIRLQFNEQATNNDGWQDRLNSTPKLIVTYTGP